MTRLSILLVTISVWLSFPLASASAAPTPTPLLDQASCEAIVASATPCLTPEPPELQLQRRAPKPAEGTASPGVANLLRVSFVGLDARPASAERAALPGLAGPSAAGLGLSEGNLLPAGFVIGLDHFSVYNALGSAPPVTGVVLRDQFGIFTTALGPASLFLVPASKNEEGIFDPFSHLTCYDVADPGPAGPAVIATNQLGAGQLALGAPKHLCVPTQKLIAPGPVAIDHYLCYPASGNPVQVGVSIIDQFHVQTAVLFDPFLFCTPVDKNGEGILNPVDHLACYAYTPPGPPPGPVPIANQFFPNSDTLDVAESFALCVPSQKQPVGPEPVDHFSVYRAIGPDAPPVLLSDQFGTELNDPGLANLFMVPANKNGEGLFDPISHLTCHGIDDGAGGPDFAVVDNQFGPQGLSLRAPNELCVPTEKLITPGPVNLDHFKCYEADGFPLNRNVDWVDQFQGIGVTLRKPFMLCNPADKNGEGILNVDEHLVCYEAEPVGGVVGPLSVLNQFSPTGAPFTLDVFDPFAFCAPSKKSLPEPSLLLGLASGALLLQGLARRRLAGRGA